MYKILFCLSLFFHLSFSSNLPNSENSTSHQYIGDKNLTTGTYYYIKEKSGKYLRWDGNYDTMKGLYFDSKDPKNEDNFQKDWFLFILEDNNNSVSIKNVKTNFYLQFYEDFGFALFQNRSKVELQKTTEDNYFNIHSDSDYMTQNSFFQSKDSITKPYDLLFDIYVIESTKSKDISAELTFEKVEIENSIKIIIESMINEDYISGTYLKRNTYYCIKSVDQKNEIKFLRSDENKFNNSYGLVLQTVYDNQCPDYEEFLFRIEGNKTQDFVKIRNKKTNSYISFVEPKNFVLMNEKSSDLKPLLKLILKNNRINIRTRDKDLLTNQNVSMNSQYIYLSESSHSTADKRIFMNIGVQYINQSASFEFVKSSKCSANAINFSISNWLLSSTLSFVFVLKFLY
jgi:hypothetical protein